MAVKKFDGVIEAARYKNGQILYVRAYERRGFTFSDRVLIERKDLIEQLKKGKKFLTGQRKELLASTFELGKPVQVVQHGEREVIATRPEASRDELEGVPVF
ncbi:MAG TPA: hypothetical protein VMT73_09965 [Anaerolineales bacterium]|nr:hypothetical protein [Anaerolineales bacterium]